MPQFVRQNIEQSVYGLQPHIQISFDHMYALSQIKDSKVY